MKPCPPGKIRNPKTGRCVDINGPIGKELAAAAAAGPSAPGPSVPSAPPGKILNPETGRYVNIDGKKGKEILAKAAAAAAPPAQTKTLEKELEALHAQEMEAMRERNIKKMFEIRARADKIRAAIKAREAAVSVPDFLKVCIDPLTKKLAPIPTVDGDENPVKLIKEEKQLLIIDDMCYDIKSLFDLIEADIKQGNVWGVNPYVRREGLIMPFDKSVKEQVLREGIKRGILPAKTKFTDHTPASADDREMRGYYKIEIKNTPAHWLRDNWASDKTAFPTKKYYAITFNFPNKKHRQNPGRTVIFPHTPESDLFIREKLIPVYEAGALWSKKMSISDGVEVINPNIHMIFEDNQPERYYQDKLKNLEEEILKFAPAFSKPI